MAINVSDVFKIRDIPLTNNCEWSVSWTGYGSVSKPENQAKIISMAMESTWNQFGVSLQDGRVHWISPQIFLDATMDVETLLEHLNLRAPINGVAFTTRASAEKFVERAEQMIIMNLLSKVVT